MMVWYDMPSPGNTVWLLVLAIVPCYYLSFFVVDSWFLLMNKNRVTAATTEPDILREPLCTLSDSFLDERDRVQYRIAFGSHSAAVVRGWPSKGGFYDLYPCFAVELDFLGLDHFQTANRSQNATDEEAHCKKLRQLGAKWWESEEAFVEYDLTHYSKGTDPRLFFGWPARGGVWVLNKTRDQCDELGTGRIYIATDMEKRCEVLEKLGAVYYENPEDCPDLDLSD